MEIETFIDATNVSIITLIFGKVPENKEAMIEHLQNIFDDDGEKVLRNKREKLNMI